MAVSLKVTTPEAARARGYTKEIDLDGGCYSLSLLVREDVDLDDCFPAFCLDSNEMLNVNGWLFT